jgi:hypothetical protein
VFLFGLKAFADLELLVRVAGFNWTFLIVSLLILIARLLIGWWLLGH